MGAQMPEASPPFGPSGPARLRPSVLCPPSRPPASRTSSRGDSPAFFTISGISAAPLSSAGTSLGPSPCRWPEGSPPPHRYIGPDLGLRSPQLSRPFPRFRPGSSRGTFGPIHPDAGRGPRSAFPKAPHPPGCEPAGPDDRLAGATRISLPASPPRPRISQSILPGPLFFKKAETQTRVTAYLPVNLGSTPRRRNAGPPRNHEASPPRPKAGESPSAAGAKSKAEVSRAPKPITRPQ